MMFIILFLLSSCGHDTVYTPVYVPIESVVYPTPTPVKPPSKSILPKKPKQCDKDSCKKDDK